MISLAPIALSILLFGNLNTVFAQQENDPGHTSAPYYVGNPICYMNSWLFADVISNCDEYGMECVCTDVKTWYEFVYYAYQACNASDASTATFWGELWCNDQGFECSAGYRNTDFSAAQAYLAANNIPIATNTAGPTSMAMSAPPAATATNAGCAAWTGSLSPTIKGALVKLTATATPGAKSGGDKVIAGCFGVMLALGVGIVALA